MAPRCPGRGGPLAAIAAAPVAAGGWAGASQFRGRRVPAGLRPDRLGAAGGPAAGGPGDRTDFRDVVPATVLWQEHDPLFPRSWSDRLAEFFTSADLRQVHGAGHFIPLEAPAEFAAAILERCH
jgi:pimeloyl-ACP methyl ester carboxylesterase